MGSGCSCCCRDISDVDGDAAESWTMMFEAFSTLALADIVHFRRFHWKGQWTALEYPAQSSQLEPVDVAPKALLSIHSTNRFAQNLCMWYAQSVFTCVETSVHVPEPHSILKKLGTLTDVPSVAQFGKTCTMVSTASVFDS